jgi:hypothetical protein
MIFKWSAGLPEMYERRKKDNPKITLKGIER